MATRTFLATETPQALEDRSTSPATATVAGTMYSVQNQSEDLLFAATAASQPDPANDATPKIIISPYSHENGTAEIDHEPGESIWVWARALGPNVRIGWDEA